MERINGLVPDAGRTTGGSSANKGRSPEPPAPEERTCPHCGRELVAEWEEFPPLLQRKYGWSGEWYLNPCTPECEQKNDQREWEAMRRDARVEALRQRSGLSKRMKDYTFSSFDQFVGESAMKAFQKVTAYTDNWEENREAGRGLYFCGGVGTGKTHLAVAVMNELIGRERVPALFVTVPELLDNLRGAYNDPGRNLDEWMEAVKNADLLLLDDLGSERVTEWVQERLFVIVNHRYRETLPTIFTSNIGPEELPVQLGERTASRIISMCEGVQITGDDHRESGRNEDS